jgi:hypothetical protein
MAVPSFVNAAAQVTSASATSIAVTLLGSRVNNNVIWAFIFVNAAGKSISASAGWTILVSDNANGASAAFAHRLVDGTETACTFSWTGAASCHGQCQQYTGNATTGYMAASGATSGTGTAVSGTGLTSVADNSLMYHAAMDSINAAFGVLSPPAQYATGGYNTAQGSFGGAAGTILKSGGTGINFAATISSANWKVLSFILQGTGAASSPTARASQVIASTLESSNRATNVLASQVVQQTLESSNRVTRVLASQVIVQVLRSVAILPTFAGATLNGTGGLIATATIIANAQARLAGTGGLIADALPTSGGGPTTWPTGLPQCPSLDGFDEEAQNNIVRFSPDVGPIKVRRNKSARNWLCNVTYRFSNAQLLIFKDFYENTLDDGTLSFAWPHPITKIMYSWMFVANEQPQVTRMTPNTSQVQFRLVRL